MGDQSLKEENDYLARLGDAQEELFRAVLLTVYRLDPERYDRCFDELKGMIAEITQRERVRHGLHKILADSAAWVDAEIQNEHDTTTD